MEQARINLRSARNSLLMGDYSWACFIAHQAGDAALKGLHQRFGQIAWGHSLADLIYELPEEISGKEEIIEKGKKLDRFYIPTRYPDAHPSGAAGARYGREDAEEAIRIAEEIVRFCEDKSLEN